MIYTGRRTTKETYTLPIPLYLNMISLILPNLDDIMKKLLLGFVFIAFFFTMIRLFAPNISETRCKLTQDFNNSQYIGRVMDKYIDSNNHSYPIVEIANSEDSILKLNLVLETNQLFNKIE